MPAEPTPSTSPSPAPSPAAPSANGAPAKPAPMALLAVSAAFVVTALALDHLTLAHGTTDQYRLMVRLASAFALAAVVVGGIWFLMSPKPRRLQWLWPVITVGVFIAAMFEYGARGR